MIRLIRTDSKNQDFISLVQKLDAFFAEIDGDQHSFYVPFNKISLIKFVVVAYGNEMPVGCGGLKEFEEGAMEIKRMYVPPEFRGRGIATEVLTELEHWAQELGFEKCVLETGKRQPDAISLYKKAGYKIIPNYGQYAKDHNSVCFEKLLNRT